MRTKPEAEVFQYIICKTLNGRPYYWNGERFTSYAPSQVTFASHDEAMAEITKFHMGRLAEIHGV